MILLVFCCVKKYMKLVALILAKNKFQKKISVLKKKQLKVSSDYSTKIDQNKIKRIKAIIDKI